MIFSETYHALHTRWLQQNKTWRIRIEGIPPQIDIWGFGGQWRTPWQYRPIVLVLVQSCCSFATASTVRGWRITGSEAFPYFYNCERWQSKHCVLFASRYLAKIKETPLPKPWHVSGSVSTRRSGPGINHLFQFTSRWNWRLSSSSRALCEIQAYYTWYLMYLQNKRSKTNNLRFYLTTFNFKLKMLIIPKWMVFLSFPPFRFTA